LPLMVTPSDVYARLLRSRAITDSIINDNDLRSIYGAGNMFEAREELLSHSEFRVTDEGLVRIMVEDRDPRRAAKLANAFVDELNALNERIVSQRARQSREFIGNRLGAIEQQLHEARQQLEEFQMTHRALDFDEQTRLAITQAADLKIELARVDLDIQLKKTVLGENNPQLVELRDRRRVIQQELDELEYGGEDSSFFALPLAAVPQLQGQYEALSSRVRVSESLYETLLELYERAKIQEQATATPLSVLDRADPPEIRSRPQRTLIVAGTTIVGFILAILLAAFLEYFRRLRETRPDDYRRASQFIDAYLGWLPGVRRSKSA
jgi:tyrosine-protein kinase Etk/Wzc